MLDRLSVADATALHAQTTRAASHSIAVLVLEAANDLSHPRLQQLVASSLPQLARFRSRLVGKPMAMGKPVWAEIADYDPTHQIHAATVAVPGGPRELAELVTELGSQELNWRQYLWQAWTIGGLASGRWALAVKMSPVLCEDGDGFPAVWQRLIAAEPRADDTSRTEDGYGQAPTTAELLTDTVFETIENHVTAAWVIAEAVTAGLLGMRRRLTNAENSPDAAADHSSTPSTAPNRLFNAPLTRHRSTAFASIRLADAKVISDAFGGSTANVVLAACTLALRSWLLRYDAMPSDPLLMAVPMSGPANAVQEARRGPTGHIRVPVQLDDPVQVLSNLHTATQHICFERSYTEETSDHSADLVTMLSLLPPWMTQAGMQLTNGLGLTRGRTPSRHGSVSLAAHAGPGYCAGSKVVARYVIEPLEPGCGLNIGVLGHDDVLDVCVTCCPDKVPDVEYMSSAITEAVDVLLAAAAESPRGQGRSVVTHITSRTWKRP